MVKRCIALLAFLLLASHGALAATLTATVDRTRLASNETLALTLEYDEHTGSEPDTRALEQQFSIVSKNQSSSFSIVNGAAAAKTTWYFELMPRKAGTLLIPSFAIEGNFSEAIQVEVKEGPRNAAQSADDIYTETEIESPQVMVQQQLVVTWRMVTALNISDPKFLPPQIDDVLSQDLGSRIYQRASAGGGVERVVEQRYALFPQRSGKLTIPAQLFQVTVNSMRRSTWGIIHQGATRVQVPTDEKYLEVLPADSSHAGVWLPAQALEISQQLIGADPAHPAIAGTAFTRVIKLRAVGLSAEQLPAPPMGTDAVKVYAENPEFGNTAADDGITGVRQDRAAIIATRPGTLLLPEIRIPWYDVKQQQWREAVLPATTLMVAAGAVTPPVTPAAGAASAPPAAPMNNTAEPTTGHPAISPWAVATGVLLLLWLATLGWLWRTRQALDKSPSTATASGPVSALADTDNAAAMQQAIREKDWSALHRTLVAWSLAGKRRQTLLGDPAIAPALQVLEKHLFRNGEAPDPALMASLPAALQQLSTSVPAEQAARHGLETLYRQ